MAVAVEVELMMQLVVVLLAQEALVAEVLEEKVKAL
jgi:hypothetical protein